MKTPSSVGTGGIFPMGVPPVYGGESLAICLFEGGVVGYIKQGLLLYVSGLPLLKIKCNL